MSPQNHLLLLIVLLLNHLPSTNTFSLNPSHSLKSTILHNPRNSLPPLFSVRSPSDLRTGIANFYDKSTPLWESVWGDHLHHGYYVPSNRTDHVQAQVDMVDELLNWGYGVEGGGPGVGEVGRRGGPLGR